MNKLYNYNKPCTVSEINGGKSLYLTTTKICSNADWLTLYNYTENKTKKIGNANTDMKLSM